MDKPNFSIRDHTEDDLSIIVRQHTELHQKEFGFDASLAEYVVKTI